MVPMHVTLYCMIQIQMDVTLWHMSYYWMIINACYNMAWYQCMSHYGMAPMHVTLWNVNNTCHTTAWYQCMSHYGMAPMHVTLWNVNNTCHTTAWYQCMSHYGMHRSSQAWVPSQYECRPGQKG